jgi:uncharacterized membrane protein YedE/YeeE
MNLIEWISQPWPWYTSGLVIAGVMLLLLRFGKSFGFSANLRTACSAMGAGKHVKFFDFNWKNQVWNLLFALGALIGGFIAMKFLSDGNAVQISAATVRDLEALGFNAPNGLQPSELFNWSFFATGRGILVMLGGGFLIGFGSRYAGGCTSGHAISGLADLQVPSLIAVIGFFIGGLAMTHLIMPLIF